MKRFILGALLLLPGLSACGGVGQSSSRVVPQSASTPLASDTAAREAASDSERLADTPIAAGPSYRLYVTNVGNNSITVYHGDASGNAAPIATIIGPNTQLNYPGQLSEDANGNLYVANQVIGPTTPSILVFAHGANGNVAPIRMIAGPLTDLSTVEAVTVDQTNGRIFAVGQTPTSDGNRELFRFPPNASGDRAPLATSQGQSFGSVIQIASDSTGNHIIESSVGLYLDYASAGLYTLKKNFPNGATLLPIYSIVNFGTYGIVDDPTTKTYLASGTDGVTQGIFRFQENTIGFGAFAGGGPPSYTPAVVSVITSETCGGQLALGHDRRIYVAGNLAASGEYPCQAGAVYVYEHDASGNAAPLRVLTGSATQLDQPAGIYEGK